MHSVHPVSAHKRSMEYSTYIQVRSSVGYSVRTSWPRKSLRSMSGSSPGGNVLRTVADSQKETRAWQNEETAQSLPARSRRESMHGNLLFRTSVYVQVQYYGTKHRQIPRPAHAASPRQIRPGKQETAVGQRNPPRHPPVTLPRSRRKGSGIKIKCVISTDDERIGM